MAVRIGAPGLTDASPVSMPTLSAPNISQRAKNFSDTRALMGAVYMLRWPLARAAKWAPAATRLFPEPVGVARMTLLPVTTSIRASVWAG